VQIFKNVLLVPIGKGGEDWNLRIVAAQHLGIMEEKSAIDALLVNIDPGKEDLLNFYCLEALGKIDNPDAYRKLVPIVAKGWETWIKITGSNGNLYAAGWALFLFKSPEAEKLFTLIWDKTGNGYSDAGYMAALALARNAQEVQPAWRDYLDKYRQDFFKNDHRVYEFARLLKGRWDIPDLAWLGSRLNNYSTIVQSWILSDMYQQPDFLYMPALDKARNTTDDGVRVWASKVAYILASSLPRPPNEKSIADAMSLAALLEIWSKEEKSSRSLSWLTDARKMAVSYVEKK